MVPALTFAGGAALMAFALIDGDWRFGAFTGFAVSMILAVIMTFNGIS